MFTRLAHLLVTRARLVLTLTVVVAVGAGILGVGVFSRLGTEGYDNPSSDSSRAAALVERDFGGSPDLVFLVHANSGTVDDPDAKSSGAALTRELEANASLTSVTSYFDTQAPSLRSTDGTDAIVLAQMTGPDDTLEARTGEILDRYNDSSDGVTSVLVGGPAGTGLGRQTTADIALAETIAIPIVLVLLVLVFGSAVAAVLPLVVAVLSIIGSFGVLLVVTQFTDVSIFAINLITALGLGLGVDYALLFVSRYREELSSGVAVRDAIITTLATAGRTIAFSAVTVLAALSAMVVFPPYFLKSFAYAGIAVVTLAALAALVVLPALLAVLGQRVNSGKLPWLGRPRAERPSQWGRLASGVMRRPLVVMIPVLVVLGLMAAPLLNLEAGEPDDRVLPASAPAHRVGDTLRNSFDTDAASSLDIVVPGTNSATDVSGLATALSEIDGVGRVDSAAGAGQVGRPSSPPSTPRPSMAAVRSESPPPWSPIPPLLGPRTSSLRRAHSPRPLAPKSWSADPPPR